MPVWESNPGHLGERRVLSSLRQPCLHHCDSIILIHHIFHTFTTLAFKFSTVTTILVHVHCQVSYGRDFTGFQGLKTTVKQSFKRLTSCQTHYPYGNHKNDSFVFS